MTLGTARDEVMTYNSSIKLDVEVTQMAEELGPIHYMMYEKIKYQDQLTARLLAADPELRGHLDHKLPPVPIDPLEQLIDQENIHGWLASRIDVVEGRLAFAQANVTENLQIMRAAGRAAAPAETAADEAELFEHLNLYLLDGMPCDRALAAVKNEEGDGLMLVQQVDTHRIYAEQLLTIDPADSLEKTCEGGHDHDDHDAYHLQEIAMPAARLDGDSTLFYQCRLAFLEGYLENSPYRATAVNATDFAIRRR